MRILKKFQLKNEKPTIKQIKKECEELCRKIIHIRDKEKCVICGSTKLLQVAHIYPKGANPTIRYELLNLLLTCYRCHHHFLHKDFNRAHDWIKKHLGEEKYNRLKMMANQPTFKQDYNALKIYLEQRLKDYEQ